MKCLDPDEIKNIKGRQLGEKESFSFKCHPDISCFNQCCRNLNLFLYPYDVVRLKNYLGISSDQFLDQYVDIVLRESSHFPEVLLKMAENSEKTCPFLSDNGCLVYLDRPGTCRTFPIEQGIVYNASEDKVSPVQFFRPPDFCMGQHESKTWTTGTWMKDQEAEPYVKMTVEWAKVKRLFQSNPWGLEGPRGPRAKMAFMAAYNVDEFRKFVFKSTFLKRYKVKSVYLKKIKKSDAELMKFGFTWIKAFLWGIQSKHLKLKTG